jgi:DNA repair exonuclease SbcCD ATPase subunit
MMELSQIEQMVRFLDEERKKDKATIAQLQERTEQQRLTIDAQAKEITDLHQHITALETDLRRTDDYPGLVEKARRDLNTALESLKSEFRRQKTEFERMRRSDVENLTQQIADLEKNLRVLPRYEEALDARAEGERQLQTRVQAIANELTDVTKRIEDRLQSLIYLEEQRRADVRRLADIEGDIPALRQTTKELNAKLTRLEDSIRRIPGRVEEAIQIAKSYDEKIEQLRVADFQREQRIRQVNEMAGEIEEEMTRLVGQTQKYTLLFNQTKQALDALEPFQNRLEKRQNEIAEMQRLNEERLKRQWEEWQTDFARDWQKRLVTEEDRWRRQDLNNQKMTEHLAELTETDDLHFEELVAVWEELRNAAERWRKTIEDTLDESQVAPSEHIKDLRRFAEESRKELP